MKSVELSPNQLPYLSELKNLLQTMEDTMIEPPQDINHALEHLNRCGTVLAIQGRVIELATLIYSHVKGLLAEELSGDEKLKEMKVHEFRLWADGRLAQWEALFQKSERMIKSLDKYCENLRTIISAEKELRKHDS